MRAAFCTSGNDEWHQSPSNAVPDARLAKALCQRFLGSVRRECLDHFLIFHEKQLSRLLNAYVVYFNQARPHQGLGQRILESSTLSAPSPNQVNQGVAVPVLGGLHHDYRRAA
jgi:putative transposase